MIVEALTEAGAPPGLLNSLQAKPEDDKNITNALISDKRIRKVDFIGSVTSGRVIASLCGACLKPCTLELEGKCPALIMEDVDIPVAAALCVQRSMMYHGQVGMNKDCMIVQETVVAQFKEAFFQALKSTPVVQDNPINKESAEKAHQVICDPELIGYQFVLGKPGFKSAASWAPIIVLSPKGSKIQDEKVLGPTVSLCIVENEKEAVELANETEYGYYAAIYTRDMVQADRMARELDYGIVHCNNSQCFTYCKSTLAISHMPCVICSFCSDSTTSKCFDGRTVPLRWFAGHEGICCRENLHLQDIRNAGLEFFKIVRM